MRIRAYAYYCIRNINYTCIYESVCISLIVRVVSWVVEGRALTSRQPKRECIGNRTHTHTPRSYAPKYIVVCCAHTSVSLRFIFFFFFPYFFLQYLVSDLFFCTSCLSCKYTYCFCFLIFSLLLDTKLVYNVLRIIFVLFFLLNLNIQWIRSIFE